MVLSNPSGDEVQTDSGTHIQIEYDSYNDDPNSQKLTLKTIKVKPDKQLLYVWGHGEEG